MLRKNAKQSGIYHYISKPFEPDYFIKTIKDIIIENEGNNIQNLNVLDQSIGLKNMGGDMEIYRQVLKEYFNENQNTLDKLYLTVSEKRYADAAQIVHKVKSSSGSIGAKELYNLSIKLQKALNDANEGEISFVQKKFSTLLRKLLKVIDELQI